MFVLSALQQVRSWIGRSAFALMLFAAIFLNAHAAFAADVLVTPASGSYAKGQTFTVTVQTDPKGAKVNAVQATMTFNPKTLSVVSISKTGSVFSLWTTEPKFDNTAGTITFGGGSPTPFSNKSNLVSITMKALTAGSANLGFKDASVLAADGKGTDVVGAKLGGSYTVTAAATPPPSSPTTAATSSAASSSNSNSPITYGDAPRAPDVGSQVFLDPETWYNKTNAVFTWTVPFDVTEVALDMATSATATPETIYKPPIEQLSLTAKNLHDGIQYLTLRFKNQVGWGAITHRKIMIDTTPPEPFTINVVAGTTQSSFPLLKFNATDVTSGIDHYELTIANGQPIKISPGEAKLGYLLKDLEDGTYTIKVTAIDKAGNQTISTTPVLITAGWTKPVQTQKKVTLWSFATTANLTILVLLLLVLFEFGYLIYERKQFTKKEEKLRKETREIQDQMEKIFSALRDEIYDQINEITKRPRLSKKEKEAVEGLNQALEVSETLIEKEITDVKKILK